MKRVLALGLCVVLTLGMVGCGKNASAASDESYGPSTESTLNNDVEEVGNIAPSDDSSSTEELTAEEPLEGVVEEVNNSATAVNTSTNWEDYLVGNVFDLTGYAEAKGYTWVQDPEYETLAMYYIDNGEIRYFFCYSSGLIAIYFGDAQGRCCHTSGILTGAPSSEYLVTSRGQDDIETSLDMIKLIVSTLNYLASPGANIFEVPGCVYDLAIRNGTVSYFSNGMIRQRDFGDIIESYGCTNLDRDLML